MVFGFGKKGGDGLEPGGDENVVDSNVIERKMGLSKIGT